MAQLRLVGVSADGRQLLLADESGDEHTIDIDERLRAGVNGHLSRLGQLTMALESRISPREIQDRVRRGESAEHVAATAGVPLERVLRFVGPVLREREHVADQGRRARLAGVGGGSGPSVLLADIVERMATRQGVDPEDVAWDSARREDHSWVVIATLPDGACATWALDLAHHQATPVDTAARKASGLPDEPVVLRLDADAPDAPVVGPESDDALDLAEHETAPLNVRPFVRRNVTAPEVEISADDEKPAEPGAADTAPEQGVSEPKRPTARAPRSSRRARVPKWDDIMFGPKSKD